MRKPSRSAGGEGETAEQEDVKSPFHQKAECSICVKIQQTCRSGFYSSQHSKTSWARVKCDWRCRLALPLRMSWPIWKAAIRESKTTGLSCLPQLTRSTLPRA